MRAVPLMMDKNNAFGNIIRLNSAFKRRITGMKDIWLIDDDIYNTYEDHLRQQGKEVNVKFEIQTIKHFRECLQRGSKVRLRASQLNQSHLYYLVNVHRVRGMRGRWYNRGGRSATVDATLQRVRDGGTLQTSLRRAWEHWDSHVMFAKRREAEGYVPSHNHESKRVNQESSSRSERINWAK